MKRQVQKALRWANALQGEFVLPTARTIYLGIACISMIAVCLALLVAVFTHLMTIGSASKTRIPDEITTTAVEIDPGIVAAHLVPPKNVRFVVTSGTLSGAITTSQILGYFDADTVNGLPNYPDDFSIIGGRDASLFERISVPIRDGSRAGLQPSNELVSRINNAPSAFSTLKTHTFLVQIIARDSAGNARTADVNIVIQTGPLTAQQPTTSPPEQPVGQTTDLQRLASDIAAKADPNHGGAFFDIYKRALRVPAICNVPESREFVAQFRRAFESNKALVQPGNTESLFSGMCEAWRKALEINADRITQSQIERAKAFARNEELQSLHEISVLRYKSIRNLALGLAGSSIIAFITICLFLAFLAMENHAKAMRDAIELLVRNQTNDTTGVVS